MRYRCTIAIALHSLDAFGTIGYIAAYNRFPPVHETRHPLPDRSRLMTYFCMTLRIVLVTVCFGGKTLALPDEAAPSVSLGRDESNLHILHRECGDQGTKLYHACIAIDAVSIGWEISDTCQLVKLGIEAAQSALVRILNDGLSQAYGTSAYRQT